MGNTEYVRLALKYRKSYTKRAVVFLVLSLIAVIPLFLINIMVCLFYSGWICVGISMVFFGIVAFLLWDWQGYKTIVLDNVRAMELKGIIGEDVGYSLEDFTRYLIDNLDTFLSKDDTDKLLQKQAEIDALRNQINPHFLYNTLDAIRSYAYMEKADVTAEMIETLSRLFRYMISQNRNLVPIGQEIGILQDYIRIQEYRSNHKIEFITNIDSDVDIMKYQIPKLIIQPLVENAINHGLSGMKTGYVISLNIYRTQSRIVISVRDNGKGMNSETLAKLNRMFSGFKDGDNFSVSGGEKRKGTGIALSNINERIKLIYGEKYGMSAYSILNRGAEFRITLPFIEDGRR